MRVGRLHITRSSEIKLLITKLGIMQLRCKPQGNYVETTVASVSRLPLLFIFVCEIGGGRLFDRPCIIANADVRAFVFDDTAGAPELSGGRWDLDAGDAWGKGGPEGQACWVGSDRQGRAPHTSANWMQTFNYSPKFIAGGEGRKGENLLCACVWHLSTPRLCGFSPP
jgi:hypothetical protein